VKRKLIEHVASILFVSCVLIGAVLVLNHRSQVAEQKKLAVFKDYINLPFADFNNPFQRELFGETLDIFYPGRHESNAAIADALFAYEKLRFTTNLERANVQERLTAKKFRQLLAMYIKFIFAYVLVMLLTYYGVQTIGVWRFVQRKRDAASRGRRSVMAIPTGILKKAGIVAASLVLFSPAYVIAYSIRTEFKTDSLVFMILLGVISNGLLIMYANKFYAFLVGESRKGYVETALVKNLRASYGRGRDGVTVREMIRPAKRFDGHVLGHIFKNARFQYYSSIKEQASFLITGLIIIEMALNIHGHLSYEMLRQILYRNFDIVAAIILGIFYVVKMTEIAADLIVWVQTRKYENRL
jgi:hypothetical protein